jgi:hypothetical protein
MIASPLVSHRTVAVLVVAAAALAVFAAPAAAEPPSNDGFGSAENLGFVATANPIGSNVEATKQSGEPAHAGDAGGSSVWYRWTAVHDGTVTVSTCGSEFDTLLGIYTGSAVNALTEVASDDESCGGHQSKTSFYGVFGTQYRIAVDGFSDGGGTPADQGVIRLHVAQGVASNNNFADAEDLGGSTTVATTGTNVSASEEANEPDHAGDPGGRSVWYVWTAPDERSVTISTCGSDFDTLLGVYTGSTVAALTEVASNDQSCGDQSKVRFGADAGTSYYVAVDGWTDGGADPADQGYVQLDLDSVASPANDDFDNPFDLGAGPTATASGTNIGASKEAGEGGHAGDPGGSSVWYQWHAPEDGPFLISTCGSDFDTLLGVYTGLAVDSVGQEAANDQSPLPLSFCAGPGSSTVRLNASGGTDYRIAVDGFSDGGGLAAEGSIELSIGPADPPANDDFAAATGLDVGAPVLATNGYATMETNEPAHAGDSGGASVWFDWTAPEGGQFVVDTCDETGLGGEFDTLLGVYTGPAVDSLTEVASNDDAGGCGTGTQSRLTFTAAAGTTYMIAVDGPLSGVPADQPAQGLFSLRIAAAPPAPPPSGGNLPPAGGGSPPDSTLPDTEIGKRPKKKTTKKSATFEFTSSEPGASFECRLDRGKFSPCASPHKVKAKAGKHSFQVRAVDVAGNLDPTPASYSWKVKKKRKRR